MNELRPRSVAGAGLSLQVNGQPHPYDGDRLRRLADVLRDDLKFTGTKIGCNAGDCGACSVLHGDESICLSRAEGDFPIRNQLVKAGDRCPCGSGLSFGRCCGRQASCVETEHGSH